MRKVDIGFSELSINSIIAQKQSHSYGSGDNSFSSFLDNKSGDTSEDKNDNETFEELSNQQISLQNQAFLNKAYMGI